MENFKAYLIREEKSQLTIEKYVRDVRRFLAWKNGRELTKEVVLAYKAEIIAQHAVASVNSMLSSLNCYLSFIGRHDCRVKTIKQQRQAFMDEGKELTRQEYERLLAAAKGKPRLHLLIQTICSTGIRVSEHRFITVEAAKAGHAEVRLKGKYRVVLLPKKLCKALLTYAKKNRIRQGSNPKCTFVSSSTRQMTPEEQSFSSNIFQQWFKQQGTQLPIGGSAGVKPAVVDTTLEQLRKAVFTEMYYLKNNGGRQYKVSSGKFIAKMNGLYAYQFEMESEVYLADDSPVKVSCMAGSAEGSVLLCEGFEILLLLDSDLGNSISSGTISVEPWKLLESLNKKIENISDLGPVARQFLYEGPTLATKLPSTHIPKGQELAKEHALNSPITVIWGPPGTGKTHTMSEIAISLLKKGKSVLLVSHSNVSVDGVAAKIASLLREQKLDQYLKDGKVLRYGYIRDELLAQDPYTSAYNYAMSKSPTLSQQMEQLSKQKEKAKAIYGKVSQEVLKLEKEIKTIRKKIRLEERKYVDHARILATTVSKIHADSLFDHKKYDVVMFDEVSMAYVAQILCAATFAKERFICVGDFRQLSPIAQSKAKDSLNKDVFSFLGISDGLGHIYSKCNFYGTHGLFQGCHSSIHCR